MNHPRSRLLFFPLLVLILAGMIAYENRHLWSNPGDSIFFTYLRSFKQGHIGYGLVTPTNNGLPLEKLQIGDIILGGWPNCAYGNYSHVGLYIGQNLVLESFVDYGVNIQTADKYRSYQTASIIRVKTDQKTREQAVDYALQHRNKIFYPVAFKAGERYWNCSKIIWMAYKKQGIDLEEINDLWIAPDVFFNSPRVEIIAERKG